MSAPPIPFRWTGDSFEPAKGFAKRCDEHFVIGMTYVLTEHLPRSQRSHNHQFAEVAEAWQQLPEHLAERFPTAEHLRKFALIKAGYCTSMDTIAASKEDARKLAVMLPMLDEYAVAEVRDRVVTVYRAKSQKRAAMDRREFQESKSAVLEVVAGMIGTTPAALAANAGRAA